MSERYITVFIIQDGESNWLEGIMLLITYAIIAISFFFISLLKLFELPP